MISSGLKYLTTKSSSLSSHSFSSYSSKIIISLSILIFSYSLINSANPSKSFFSPLFSSFRWLKMSLVKIARVFFVMYRSIFSSKACFALLPLLWILKLHFSQRNCSQFSQYFKEGSLSHYWHTTFIFLFPDYANDSTISTGFSLVYPSVSSEFYFFSSWPSAFFMCNLQQLRQYVKPQHSHLK